MTAFNRSDHQILQALQANAHRSDAALGDQIGLSESAVRRHRHRLEADGFVQGYVALVDQRRLGYRETVFVTVMLEAQAKGDVFENEVRTMPEVMACYAVAGEEDYLLRVVARDVGHFDRVLGRVSRMPAVRHVHSHVVLHQIFNKLVLPATVGD